MSSEAPGALSVFWIRRAYAPFKHILCGRNKSHTLQNSLKVLITAVRLLPVQTKPHPPGFRRETLLAHVLHMHRPEHACAQTNTQVSVCTDSREDNTATPAWLQEGHSREVPRDRKTEAPQLGREHTRGHALLEKDGDGCSGSNIREETPGN